MALLHEYTAIVLTKKGRGGIAGFNRWPYAVFGYLLPGLLMGFSYGFAYDYLAGAAGLFAALGLMFNWLPNHWRGVALEHRFAQEKADLMKPDPDMPDYYWPPWQEQQAVADKLKERKWIMLLAPAYAMWSTLFFGWLISPAAWLLVAPFFNNALPSWLHVVFGLTLLAFIPLAIAIAGPPTSLWLGKRVWTLPFLAVSGALVVYSLHTVWIATHDGVPFWQF